MHPGDTFFLQTNTGAATGRQQSHLFVVVRTFKDSRSKERYALIVCFDSTVGPFAHDAACVFAPNSTGHPFLLKESYVNYRFSEIALVASLVNRPDFRDTGFRISQTILNRIIEGSDSSSSLKHKFHPYYKGLFSLPNQ